MKRQFVSYPKSGRSWVRFILFQLDFHRQIRFHHDGFEFNDGSMPEQTISYPKRSRMYLRDDKVIYLERNPLDVMVSLYFQITGRFDDYFNYTGSISDFIRDEYFGATNLYAFRNVWNELVDQRGYLKITYEQCVDNTYNVIMQVLEYYNFCYDRGVVKDAVEKASFDNMRKVEEMRGFSENWLKPRNNSFKVREGKVGGYKNYLTDSDINFLNNIFF